MRLLHFLLVPDKSSARRVKRMVAENLPRLDVLVGTWPELLELTRKSYILSQPQPEDWQAILSKEVREVPDGFWQKSFAQAPEETISALSWSLAALIEGAGPDRRIEPDRKKILSDRAGRHLADLALLHEKMEYALPPHLAIVDGALKTDCASALRKITVYHVPDLPKLSPWQNALLEKIEKDFADAGRDKDLETLLEKSLTWEKSRNKTALDTLQQNLFNPAAQKKKLDDTVQWIAVRDYLEEAEIAAGMVQKLVKEKKISHADIGLLIPSDSAYAEAVRDVFSFAGIPLSGLNAGRRVRDLGREAALNFLITRRRPAPVMALASLYSNPLMPWTGQEGARLAQEVMEGRFTPKLFEGASVNCRRMLELIQAKEMERSEELTKSLKSFIGLLANGTGLEDHMARAQDLANDLVALLPASGKIPWEDVMSRSAPASFYLRQDETIPKGGVAVFAEDEEPWREVRYLLILGFSSGRYPSGSAFSAVFLDSDISLLKQKLCYGMETAADIVSRKRALFRRQLTSASDMATFFIPRKSADGENLHPSDTLPFMARLFASPKAGQTIEAGDLIFELDTAEGREKARWLSLAKPSKPDTPWTPALDDPKLGCDLLKLRVDKEGNQKAESPSSLEKLIVSPFAWVLSRYGLEPREWAPETLNVALRGSIAHEVLKHFFNESKPIPPEKEIRQDTPKIFSNVIQNHAPFLLAAEWSVERRNLEQEICESAIWWRERLTQMNAKVVGAETDLNGSFDSVPIRGRTDLLIEVSGGRLFVVDYKKSSSQKFRQMMREGYASQVALYRIMLETGDYAETENKTLTDALKRKREIGVLYALLNDRKVLTDSDGWLGNSHQDVTEMGGEPIAENALKKIRERFQDLRQGIVKLNTDADEKWFEKETGIKATYTLDASPLVRLFMHDSVSDTEEVEE